MGEDDEDTVCCKFCTQVLKTSTNASVCRLEARRQAMINMPQLIKDWKEVCYLKPPRPISANNTSREVMVGDGRSGPND